MERTLRVTFALCVVSAALSHNSPVVAQDDVDAFVGLSQADVEILQKIQSIEDSYAMVLDNLAMAVELKSQSPSSVYTFLDEGADEGTLLLKHDTVDEARRLSSEKDCRIRDLLKDYNSQKAQIDRAEVHKMFDDAYYAYNRDCSQQK